jgi:hypothetical protein
MLQRDRTKNPSVRLAFDALFRFERRLQAIGPMTIGDHPAGELVDDADAAVAHDVVDVTPQQDASVKRAVDLGQQAVMLGVVQAAHLPRALDLLHAGLGQLDVATVFVDVEMHPGGERSHQRGQARRGRDLAFDAAGDDQGHARLVDQERIRFVDERVTKRTVDERAAIHCQQIAQLIESRLFGGHIRDVGEIRAPPLGWRHALLDEPDRKPEPGVDRPHPLGIAARQIVVDGQDVDASAGKSMQRGRHDGCERLPLASLHLHDVAIVHRECGENLHIERPQAESAVRYRAGQREEFLANLPGRRARLLTKIAGACLNLPVG